MKLLSVNVGLPREIEWQGKLVRTSIFKSPASGNVRVKTLNLEGDEQSDLSVHGGVYKAVYAYPSEHYQFWREEVPGIDLPLGVFGENLTTEGLLEQAVRIGDLSGWICAVCHYSTSTALFQARYPIRSPGNGEAFSAQRSDWILFCRPRRGRGHPRRRDRVHCSG